MSFISTYFSHIPTFRTTYKTSHLVTPYCLFPKIKEFSRISSLFTVTILWVVRLLAELAYLQVCKMLVLDFCCSVLQNTYWRLLLLPLSTLQSDDRFCSILFNPALSFWITFLISCAQHLPQLREQEYLEIIDSLPQWSADLIHLLHFLCYRWGRVCKTVKILEKSQSLLLIKNCNLPAQQISVTHLHMISFSLCS